MAYDPHAHEPVDPDRGSMTGFAAIKYTAIVIVVLAILSRGIPAVFAYAFG